MELIFRCDKCNDFETSEINSALNHKCSKTKNAEGKGFDEWWDKYGGEANGFTLKGDAHSVWNAALASAPTEDNSVWWMIERNIDGNRKPRAVAEPVKITHVPNAGEKTSLWKKIWGKIWGR